MKSSFLCGVLTALALFWVSVYVSGAELSPNDLRPKVYETRAGISLKQRLVIVGALKPLCREYIDSLESTSWKDFGSTSQSGEIVASLMTELEDTKILMNDFLKKLQNLEHNPNHYESWLLLVRNFYLVAPYMVDLDERGVVKSTAYIGLRLWLPFVFDGILLPSHNQP